MVFRPEIQLKINFSWCYDPNLFFGVQCLLGFALLRQSEQFQSLVEGAEVAYRCAKKAFTDRRRPGRADAAYPWCRSPRYVVDTFDNVHAGSAIDSHVVKFAQYGETLFG